MMKNSKLKKDIIKFFEMELKTYDYEDESVLHNKREKKKFKIETYNDEIVRSKEECEIANFLFRNQIKYMYEKTYTKDNNYGVPDFYLKDYDKIKYNLKKINFLTNGASQMYKEINFLLKNK